MKIKRGSMQLDARRRGDTRSWFVRARKDFRCAQIDLAAVLPALEDALDHCQQAAEKALKGFLAWHDQPFPKTHDLGRLGQQAVELDQISVADLDTEKNSPWWHCRLNRLYHSLTWNDPVESVDLIFVMAGRMERKLYGLELYRAGIAPRLVLSVGRFEVSKMSRIEWEGLPDLIALRERTQPADRHFFVEVDSAGVHIERAKLQRWNTYGEALGLRQLLEGRSLGKVMIISTEIHLRRVVSTLNRVFHDVPVEFLYCPVPPRLEVLRRDRWWSRPYDRSYVLKEMLKLVGYVAILSMPAWALRRLMRLKK